MRFVAVLLGAAAYALALPPVDLAGCGWIALVPLLLAVRGQSLRRALLWGALAGFASGWAVTWWLAGALARYFAAGLVQGALGTSAAYLATLCTTFGAFGAAAAWLLAPTTPRGRPASPNGPRTTTVVGLLGIAAVWTLLELLRSRVLGQPWALLGYTQHDVTPFVQLATVAGVPGLSFVVAFGNACIAEALYRLRSSLGLLDPARALAPALLLWGTVTLAGALVVPPLREPSALPGTPTTPADRLTVTIVQANIPPAFHWTRAYTEAQLLTHLRETTRALRSHSSDLVVWPEHALGFYLDQEPWVVETLARLARSTRTTLLLGAPRWADGHTFNSAWLIDRRGTIAAHYDKQRLVPFAESPLLPTAIDPRPSSRPEAFSPGRTPKLLPASVLVATSICQEGLYPALVHGGVLAGGTVLVNLANDGWLDFGHGVGSRQHAAMTALRAVESRRWLVRAATTGVSMVVDPWGRVRAALPVRTAGTLVATVEARPELTIYVRWGDSGTLGVLLLLVAVTLRHRSSASLARFPETPTLGHRNAA